MLVIGRMKNIIVFIIITACVVLASDVQACPGRPLGYYSAEHVENKKLRSSNDVEVAFIGKVVDSKALWLPFGDGAFSRYDKKTTFEVIKTLKGDPKKYRTIYHSLSDKCYGVTFSESDTFLILPSKFKRKWVVSIGAVGTYKK